MQLLIQSTFPLLSEDMKASYSSCEFQRTTVTSHAELQKRKKQKGKGYTLHTISIYVCEINNTKTIKRTTNIL